MSGSAQGTLGSYRLLEELACPSGGRAFRAADLASETPILLHLLPQDVPDELLRETRRLNRLHRPGIPVLYEVGESPQGTFVAFAPPPGKTLAEFVTKGGRVDRETLVTWIAQTLGLLAEAHAEDILHRNLSAETVIIADDGTLGLAGFSLTNLAAQSPELQAPEQRADEKLTVASDLFSLAALFQRLAAPADVGGAATAALSQDDPLVAVLGRGAHPDPAKRFQDAAEMEMVVQRAAQPQQVQDVAFRTMVMQPSALQELLAQEAPGARRLEVPDETVPERAAPEAQAPPRAPSPAARAHSELEAMFAAPPATALKPAPGAPSVPAPGPAESAPSQRPSQKRRRWPGTVAALLALTVALGGFAVWKKRQAQPPMATGARSGAAPIAEGPLEPRTDPVEAQDPALRLAQLLLRNGDARFGAMELGEDERQLLEEVQAEIAAISFGDDPRGSEPARSLFGEHPLLAKSNPLLTEGMRERWLGEAIHTFGPEHALEHLREESERLRRGEVTRAEWYAHVAQCKELCNRVVSGLLYQHVQQVRSQPNYLVLFPSSGANLSAEHRAALEAFLSAQQGATHLLLIGRSSRGGNRDYDRELSSRRVASVQEAAEKLGIDEDRINAFWLGHEPPRLTPELARVYGLKADVPLEELNQSVLVVAYHPEPA